MDLKAVMPGLPQPSRMGGTTLPQAEKLPQAAVPTGDIPEIDIAAGMIKGLFAKTTALLAEQEALLQSLPSPVRAIAEQILQNSLPDISTLGAGLVSLIHTRRSAADSLVQLAEKLQLAASTFNSSQDNPAEMVIAIKRFNQQLTGILAQLDLTATEDPVVLQQAREQIRATMPEALRQAAASTEPKLPSATVSVPAAILQAAGKLNLPELPQLWLLANTDLASIQDDQPTLNSSQGKPAELLIAIKRFTQQVASTLAELDFAAVDLDPAVLQQAREQIRAAMPEVLRQAAASAGQKLPSAAVSVPAAILQAADKLNLPELPQLWLLADTDLASVPDDTQPALSSTQDKPAALLIAIKRFTQQAASSLAELDFAAADLDPAVLQQAREQIRAAMPDELRQAAARFATQQSSSGNVSIPLMIRQAADKLNLPELLQLWPLNDRELVTLIENTSPDVLKQSASTVRTLAELVNRAFQTTSDDQGQAILLTLQMPFNGEPAQPQPVHIHVFHEKGQTKNDGSESKPDTWVRITLQPEYTGQVDTVFHLYGEDILDIRVVFANKQASLLFGETVPLIREACSEFPFLLGDVSVV